ncbi:hypothetical protein N0V93_009939 [Gnomoniopsis smithogilvyi]|uniref:Protein kinase domain-containing protein n=1 Tax=Gnomoniopsis smithogilvyi TaxID=1191159 RepID=A0A9W9CSS8_9PEZI|nr:hypothetical protein N0V93_009939 [Gnomoniopsis smithogilvyi]
MTPCLRSSWEPSHDEHDQIYETALREFRDLRQTCTLKNFNDQPFVLVDALKKVLHQNSNTQPGDNYRHDLHRLFATSHFRRSTDPPFGLDELSKYYRILFILLELECSHLIEAFHQRNLCDIDLPLNRSRLENEIGPLLRKFGCDPEQFYTRFDKEQFDWCPLLIEQGMHDVYRNQVVPFLSQTEIRPRPTGNGSRLTQYNATLFTIEIPEELIGPKLTKQLDPNLFWEKTHGQDDKPMHRSIRYYKFALKQFPRHLEEAFRKENQAFIGFGVQEGMIQYVGNCEDTHSTFSIILELGDCDLYTAIRNELPPVSPTEINAFWFAMLGLAKALAKIYKTRKDGLTYNVWHADIKPENILRVGNRFKLADPGEAHIVVAHGESEPAGAFITGGTRTYAAPEKAPYLESDAVAHGQVPQSSDVWSLGCVFSVAATYVVLGTQGVLQFDEVRRQCAKNPEAPQHRNWPDAFYDGPDVRKVVTDWHAYLRSAIRRTDGLTATVLTMIDDRVLVPADKRWDAVEFSQRLEELIDGNHPPEARPVPGYIEEMLREIDPKAMFELERSTDGRSRVESGRTKKLLQGSYRSSQNSTDIEMPLTDVGRLLNERIKPTAQRFQKKASEDKNPQGSQTSLEQPTFKTLPGQASRHSSTPTGHANRPHTELDTDLSIYRSNEGMWIDPGHEVTQRPPTMTMWQLQRMLKKSGMQRKGLTRKKAPAPVKSQLGEEDHLAKYYKGRDIVYLVDNGSSMLPHWGEVCFLLHNLIWRSLGYDEDGMEVYYTNPDTKACRIDQDLTDFDKYMDDAEPLPHGHKKEYKTNLCFRLDRLISSDRSSKPKTIIVLTDGLWEGNPSEDAIQQIIELKIRLLAGVSQAETNTQHDRLTALARTRPFTIQFISFGHDKQGLERMAALDDDITDYPDLIDVEPSNGDVNKMFAGSLDDKWDNKENNVNRPPATPARSSYKETL